MSLSRMRWREELSLASWWAVGTEKENVGCEGRSLLYCRRAGMRRCVMVKSRKTKKVVHKKQNGGKHANGRKVANGTKEAVQTSAALPTQVLKPKPDKPRTVL